MSTHHFCSILFVMNVHPVQYGREGSVQGRKARRWGSLGVMLESGYEEGHPCQENSISNVTGLRHSQISGSLLWGQKVQGWREKSPGKAFVLLKGVGQH